MVDVDQILKYSVSIFLWSLINLIIFQSNITYSKCLKGWCLLDLPNDQYTMYSVSMFL
jgi:hypothetical protein